MKTIKFYHTRGFRNGHEYELDPVNQMTVIIPNSDERKRLTLEFLRLHKHEFTDYGNYGM